MSLEAWFTVGTIALVIAALVTNRISTDVAMIGGLTLLMLGDFFLPGDVVAVPDAISGFAHPALLLIGALFVVAAGLQGTGGMEMIAQRLLGRPKSIIGAQLRLMLPVTVMSAFMNNTPIVAMYLPIVNDWAKKLRISPSKLYLPLSFASIMGGKLTYLGTSSNIVVMGLYIAYLAGHADDPTTLGVGELSAMKKFWGVALVGAPSVVVGTALIVLTSRWLLPERRPATQTTLDARKYQVEMLVRPDSPIVGKTIEQAGLRHLPGLFLTSIEREGHELPAVGPDERLQADDRLSFAGILESVVDLRKIRGLEPATDQVKKVDVRMPQRTLVEAVVARNSPLVGRTVRGARFRTVYNAAIIAVHRAGQRVRAKIGDIILQRGDTLLLETHHQWVDAYRNSDHFYLVSKVEGSRPIRHERAWLSLAILAMLVIMFTLTPVNQVISAFLCAMLMVGTRCVTGTVARQSINWQVLLVIAAALGMGRALEQTGAAQHIADSMMAACTSLDLGPRGVLFVMFIITAMFSQLITNNGAAVLMFPIVVATGLDLGVSIEPFVFTMMVAAGASFISPVAYQTNLMVYGPGGYKFMDFVKIGTPLTLLTGVVCTLIAPVVFPFTPTS
ncbi:MAG: SLC13 family permease [Phycisphaerales bacterium]|nr:MAG: SLC13 family permease [Phycisphaerales bacterium]